MLPQKSDSTSQNKPQIYFLLPMKILCLKNYFLHFYQNQELIRYYKP